MKIVQKILGSEMYLIGGRVTQYAEGTGAATGKVVNIKLDDNTKVAFWNTDSRKLADRVKAARLKVGSFISILVTFKDEEQKQANAINFKYNGIWTFEEKPTATMSGRITNIQDNGGSVMLYLSDGSRVPFENQEKGYKLADRIKQNAKVGDFIEIATKDNKVTNYKIGDNWAIMRNVSAIIGSTSFLDEGHTLSGASYIRVNESVYQGKDSEGNNVYENAHVYFDNTKENMIRSVKEKIPPRTKNILVCSKNQNSENTYTGYYFIPL